MAATVKAGAKARPARTPPAAPVQPPPPSGPLRFTTPAETIEDEREPLFFMDDREYTIPVDPGLGVSYDTMHVAREQGTAAAEDYFMTAMLGEDGWAELRRLLREKIISKEDFLHLVEVCRDKAMGAMEDEESPNR
jgi:hypothetical protein